MSRSSFRLVWTGSARLLSALLTPAVISSMCATAVALSAQSVPEVRLGTPEAAWEDRFTGVTSVRELSDGRVLIADRAERRLYLADPSSGSVATVGRQGEGPGEYRVPGRLYALRGDSTLFTDAGSRRWLFLDGDRIVRTISGTRPLPNRFGTLLSGVSEEGRVVGIVGTAFQTTRDEYGVTDRSMADSLRAVRSSLAMLDAEEPVMDTLPPVLGGPGRLGVRRSRSGPYVSIRPSPLATEDQMWLFGDGWIAAAYEGPYRVEWLRPDGTWISGEALPGGGGRVDRDEQCFAVERTGVEECDLDRFPEEWPETVPPFLRHALLPAPDGTLLIRRTPSAADPRSRYDRVDREGKLVEVLVLEDDEALVGSSPDALYLVRTGELGLQSLRRVPWP